MWNLIFKMVLEDDASNSSLGVFIFEGRGTKTKNSWRKNESGTDRCEENTGTAHSCYAEAEMSNETDRRKKKRFKAAVNHDHLRYQPK